MYGNTPDGGHNGGEPVDLTPEQRRLLRREVVAVAADIRTLLPDEFVVGSEIIESAGGPEATVAVQPPAGSVVSAGFTFEDEADRADLARQLAAGAALEVKRALDEPPQAAR